jgi:hypothetical protein
MEPSQNGGSTHSQTAAKVAEEMGTKDFLQVVIPSNVTYSSWKDDTPAFTQK